MENNDDDDEKNLVIGGVVRIRLMGDSNWTHGIVELVSKNQISVAIRLYEPVRTPNGGIIVGFLLLLVDHEKQLATEAIFGGSYELEYARGIV